MADSRILHRKAGGSQKVNALTNLEFRVWTQAAILSPDDFGVMPATAAILQADNVFLRRTKARLVQASLEQVIAVGLLLVFTHQGERFVWQADWQDWQQIRYPRTTVNPAPSSGDLSVATPKTIDLFRRFHSAFSPHYSGNGAEIDHQPVRAGAARNTHTNTHTDTDPGSGGESAREGPVPPVWNHGVGRHGRGLVGDHRGCFHAPNACARGLCIPAYLGQRWTQQLESEDSVGGVAEYELRKFITAELEKLPPGPIGDKPGKFWEAAWNAYHGSQAPAIPSGRESSTAHTLRSAREVLDAVDAAGKALKS